MPTRRETGMNNKPNVREIVMDRLCKAPARAAQVVVVSRHEDFGFTPDQFGPGWDVRRIHQVRDLDRVVRGSAPMAGVIDLQAEYSDAELAQLEQSLQHQHVTWVAITTEAQLADPRVRFLIRDYCVDYVRTPFSHEELLYTLKHAHGMACLHHGRTTEMASHGAMIGECAPMRSMFRSLAKVAHNEAPVFTVRNACCGDCRVPVSAWYGATGRTRFCGAATPWHIAMEASFYKKCSECDASRALHPKG